MSLEWIDMQFPARNKGVQTFWGGVQRYFNPSVHQFWRRGPGLPPSDPTVSLIFCRLAYESELLTLQMHSERCLTYEKALSVKCRHSGSCQLRTPHATLCFINIQHLFMNTKTTRKYVIAWQGGGGQLWLQGALPHPNKLWISYIN